MLSMHGVSSALIARNESWVRQQASALVRRLPSNVEKADLIQVGLIAVAQSALGFKWEGDPDSDEARDAFVRYARLRVKGAMLDELRQMDVLQRAQRRKVKALQIARERWHSAHGSEPGLTDLSQICGIDVDEIAALEHAAHQAQTQSLDAGQDDEGEHSSRHHPATPKDEVEARVDTAIVLRHLESFFAKLPERERQVIDAYLGVGMSPVQLAGALRVSPSRVSNIYKMLIKRIVHQLGFAEHRTLNRVEPEQASNFDSLVDQRESELATTIDAGAWGEMVEHALTLPPERFGGPDTPRMPITSSTRWG
jgi:RNA polymerase sigma factor for flagellar operon FliA